MKNKESVKVRFSASVTVNVFPEDLVTMIEESSKVDLANADIKEQLREYAATTLMDRIRDGYGSFQILE